MYAFVASSAFVARAALAATSFCPVALPAAAASLAARAPRMVFTSGPGMGGHGHGHGHGHGAVPTAGPGERRPGEHKGFVEEMRFVAMKMHTKDQAREGKMEESALPIQMWRPEQKDYLQFLVDSLQVYDYIESSIANSSIPEYDDFRNTGLERTAALHKDIEWFTSRGFTIPKPTAAATSYVEYLRGIVEKNPPAFVCHWYNFYFAHTAGGRMIGKMMSNMLFQGHEFEFYKWDRDVKQILEEVRVKIDHAASGWSRELKDDCLKETSLSFAYSGTILEDLAKA